MELAILPILNIFVVMPKLVNHDERRADISAAAAQAIDEYGLDRVRLVDVARLAHCTTGAVSHYFRDKDAVLAAALEYVLQDLTRYRAASIPEVINGDPVDAFILNILEVLPIDTPRRRDWRVWIAFCGRAVSSPALAAIHREAYADVQQVLSSWFIEFDLAAPGPDAQLLASAAFASFDGLGLRATLEPNEWPVDRLQATLACQLGPLLRTPREIDSTQFIATHVNPANEEKSA